MSNVNKGSAKEKAVKRIQGSILIRKLQEFALTKPDSKEYKDKLMTQTQVHAARILLAKVLPDQKAVEQTIKDERAKTKEEIFTRLRDIGLDPQEIWQSVSKH